MNSAENMKRGKWSIPGCLLPAKHDRLSHWWKREEEDCMRIEGYVTFQCAYDSMTEAR